MANLQIKALNDDLYNALKRRSQDDQRSLSQEVIKVLQDFLSGPQQDARKSTDEFLAMCGDWVEEKTPHQIIKEIRNARKNKRL